MIRFSPLAAADVRSIAEWLREEAGIRVATDVSARIIDAARLLKTFPSLARTGRVQGTREMIVKQSPYIIVYAVEAGDVVVLRVLHGSRLWPPPDPTSHGG